jgi:uncharacterized damage-inducible protein DinB
MNADAFRHLYGYHFSENRIVWDRCVSQLTDAQFTQPAAYSHGSVRDQIVHLMSADEMWFSELQNIDPPEPFPAEINDREVIRARWDRIEHGMRGYLENLQDTMLFQKPIKEPEEDQVLYAWQVLLHVVNHGTDHRAQLLRVLNDFGIKTVSQDYIFYIYDHLK